MQAQAAKPQELSITAAQSLQTVHTLLRAGMGCIAYLRDLLPEENFESRLLTATNDGSISTESSGSSFFSSNRNGASSRTTNGFAVTTITRGWSAEADKLLDYLENGIFDAIEKQYLRSFIFAIYLDPEDPNNIIEAYTFNFEYRRIAGTDVVVPIMSLGEDMKKLSLGNGGYSKDPITLASAVGRLPTFKDVKRSLKVRRQHFYALPIKLLADIDQDIDSSNNSDGLSSKYFSSLRCVLPLIARDPERRYATYKAFYYPRTPSTYEPPLFTPGDSEVDRFFFSTHGKDEVPERWGVGKLETGWHGVDVHVASVSAYIPSAETNDCSPLSEAGNLGTLASDQRLAQIEVQKQDARDRTTIWDAEKIGRLDSLDVDAEFDDDPDFPQHTSRDSEIGPDEWVPMGTRTEGGVVVPSTTLSGQPESYRDIMDVDAGEATQELLFTGRAESVPDCVQHLKNDNAGERSVSLPPTQKVVTGSKSPERSLDSLPPSDIPMQGCSLPNASGSDIDTQLIIDLMKARTDTRGPDGEEILSILQTLAACSTMIYGHIPDTNTQPPFSLNTETIESFPIESPVSYDDIQITPKDSGNASTDANALDGVLDCDCHVLVDDECTLCEGGCKRWYHIWCMGYHSHRDKRLPNVFVCFHCSLRKDKNWEIIKVQNWYEELLGNFSRLALFRRAIKIAEIHKPESSSAFAKLIQCEPIVAAQLFKRLQVEVAPKINNEGTVHPDSKREKKNGRNKVKQQRTVRQNYVFVTASKRGQKYRDYFDPNNAVQLRVMGMEETVMREDVTQNAANSPTSVNNERKRKTKLNAADEINGELSARKKIKISIVPAVNLYD
ncbi:HORMA domain-containing protein [Lactarius akahatsu]|uniref:HORMA domain-containing protein n=1 Tax=Lactarius akahatsu TaxID=416441 RepID=A0AAD4LUZ9_9AGAM|nr:HORMA domain-containing protein [Lactarius akahatsu]